MESDIKAFIDDFDLLSKHGVVGLFDHFQIVELVCFDNKSSIPINVFTVATAIENGKPEEIKKLNEDRIKLANVKDKSFGIFRSVQSLGRFRGVLKSYYDKQIWKVNEKVISVSDLQPLLKQSVPANGSTDTPLNHVIKNNFFNGSYVLELSDLKKDKLQWFFDLSTTLQEFSKIVSGVIPIKIASVADRLGNVIIQFPVEAVRTSFHSNGSTYNAEVAWHPNIPERDLSFITYTEYDHSIVSFGQKQMRSGSVVLSPDPGYGFMSGAAWDVENNILLAATGELAPIETITMNVNMIEHEPRAFSKTIEHAEPLIRVQLTHRQSPIIVGGDKKQLVAATSKRIYDREIADLTRQRKFIQYGAGAYSRIAERERALDDIRALVASYGTYGVYLWDPYLAPQDIVDTLFYNKAFGAPMKALTSLEEYKCQSREPTGVVKDDRLKVYGEVLEKLDGNFLGLNIEYRSGHGPHG